MQASEGVRTWRETLSGLPGNDRLGTAILDRYGDRVWEVSPADKNAAHAFHIQLISRISTQRLGYGFGVEDAALRSLHALFEKAREITQACPGAGTVEILVWQVMNVHVRPFTAKWHQRNTAGLLGALDESDEFREELARVQGALRGLDDALRLILESPGYEPADDAGPLAAQIEQELRQSVVWRPAGVVPGRSDRIAEAERDAVRTRRAHYSIPERDWAAGIALSGGGIRSATFSIGVLSALARRDLLPQFDYLSTVSGGGYAGCFLTQLLGAPEGSGLGLRSSEAPFCRTEGESKLLRALRQRARYLSGTFWERVFVAMRQTYGVFANFILLLIVTTMFAYIDAILRPPALDEWGAVLAIALPLGAVLALAFLARRLDAAGTEPGWKHLALGSLFILPPTWYLLGLLHTAWDALAERVPAVIGGMPGSLAWASAVSALVLAAAFAATFSRVRPLVVGVLTATVMLVAESILVRWFSATDAVTGALTPLAAAVAAAVLFALLDVNLTSLNSYYRAKLSAAFLLDAAGRTVRPIKLSEVRPERTMFPILNCALNVPGSLSPAMRGRLSDIFSFTPVSTGSALVGHHNTAEWEAANPHLDLATVMALSGAAASPQMGLRTTRLGSFWLTLLNVRLGLWLRQPAPVAEDAPTNRRAAYSIGPRLPYLLREFAASAREDLAFLHVSDGGHIENLGVYELLRRRCRYILAVDGENDPAMTFHALTNLQRLAYIDLGVVIEANLDDLRLESGGVSRSHFRFCRICYPAAPEAEAQEIGYLVYLKLSLTGNEGEFIRRYRLDEPAFPHHSTADQFFSEAQFEAYRSLGEHVGEKLFLTAIVGDMGRKPDVDLQDWICALGRSLL